jgi:tetratricopeptide (TPR) repeat protein
MALAFIGLGEYDHALEQAERLDETVLSPSGPYVRAKVFVKKKQYQKAYDILVQRIFPLEKGVDEILAIGDLYDEDKVYGWAVKAYGLAFRKDPKDTEALKKLKGMRLKMRGAQ